MEQKILIALALILFAAPSAHAMTLHVTCADTDDYGYGLCAGNIWTLTNVEDNFYLISGLDAGTYYASYHYNYGTGDKPNLGFYCWNGASFCNGSQTANLSSDGDNLNIPFTITGAHSSFHFDNVLLSGTPMSGNISDLCITDTSGACEAAPPAPQATTTPFAPTAFSNFIDRYALMIVWICGGFLFLAILKFAFQIVQGFRDFITRHHRL